MTRAWKFLAPGARSPIAGEPWALGAWRDEEDASPGVRVLDRDDLAWWLGAELWEVEAEGTRRETNALRAERARLVRRIEAWDALAAAMCDATRARVHRAIATPAEGTLTARLVAALDRIDDVVVATYVAATALASTADTAAAQRARFEAERAAQSAWIADQLAL